MIWFHLFIFFSLMNWSVCSYSAGKLIITRAHCHTMSVTVKHANIGKKLGLMASM